MKCQIQHLQGSKKGQVEEITAQRITLGRDPANTLAFDPYIDADCSGNHAALEEREDGFIYAVDLNSRNGTFVNGAPVPPGPAGTVCPPGSMVQLCKAGPALKLDYTPGKNRMAPAPKPPPPPPEPGSNNGLIIGIAIGAVVLILIVVVIIVLTRGGDDEKKPEHAGEGPRGVTVAGGSGAGAGPDGAEGSLTDGEAGGEAPPVAAGNATVKDDAEAGVAAIPAIPAVPPVPGAEKPVVPDSAVDEVDVVAAGLPANAVAKVTAKAVARSVALSKDGKVLVAGFEDGTLVAGKAAPGKAKRAKVGDAPVLAVASLADDGASVRALSQQAVVDWRWAPGAGPQPVNTIEGFAGKAVAGALSADGRKGALASGGAISVFDAAKGGKATHELEKINVLDKEKKEVSIARHKTIKALGLSPDGAFLGSMGDELCMRLYGFGLSSPEDAKVDFLSEKGPDGKARRAEGEGSAISFSADGSTFAFAIGEKALVFTVDKPVIKDGKGARRSLGSIVLEVPEPDALALSPDGKLLAYEGGNHSIVVLQLVSAQQQNKVAVLAGGHTDRIRALAFGGTAAAPMLISAGKDRTAVVWQVPVKK